MGIYDRDYVREEPRGFGFGGDMGMVAKIIIANVAVYIAEMMTRGANGSQVANLLTVHVSTLTQPLQWWRFVTYGFVHSPDDVWHIIGNMMGLFFLGRAVETRYGAKEFLRLYLVMIVVSGVTWAILQRVAGGDPRGGLLGASGAVTGVILLLVLNYPRRQVLLFFAIPVPLWLVGLFLVGSDVNGAIQRTGNVAFTAHLAGAAFAAAYFYGRWNLGQLLPGQLSWASWRRWRTKSRLKVHRPPMDDRRLTDELDRILEKISNQGEASLTAAERRTLQDASRHYQDRSKKS
jgi:membrane associated rhomboid family serine protease